MADEKLSLEAHIARLEEIVAGLERDDLELDKSLELFEEGIGHLRVVRSLLRATELRLERLIDTAEGVAAEDVPDE